MHLDPILPSLVLTLLVSLVFAAIARSLAQPVVVGYLIAGILLGAGGLGVITDVVMVSRLGAIGVVFLLFFIGMELSPADLRARWRIAVLGTIGEIALSVGSVWLVGAWLDWPFHRILILGFVISLSSTAVVVRILEEWREQHSDVGKDVTAILLAQDLAIVPMLAIVGFLAGHGGNAAEGWRQLAGGVAVLGLLVFLVRRDSIHLPLQKWIGRSDELQVFAALALCLGLALLTGVLGLSTAFGAFLGGIILGMARETRWVVTALKPFEVVLVALFFLSVGLQLDIAFLRDHGVDVIALVAIVLILNTGVNAAVLRLLGVELRNALYAGALLSQIGEFSFVLAAVAHQAEMLSSFGYQMTLAVICGSIILSPPWARLIKRMTLRSGELVTSPSSAST